MLKRLFPLFALSAIAVFAQRSETVFFRGVMLPSNEVPAIDIAASGFATIKAHVVRNASGQIVSGSVDFTVSYTFPGEMTFTGLHIHRGAAGTNGPVIINTGLSGTNTVVDATGRGTIDRQAQVLPTDTAGLAVLNEMMTDPAAFYVNLHSTVNPGGVIRAQLQRPDMIQLMAIMSPLNEVPPIPTSNASGVAAIQVMRTFNGSGAMNSALVTFEVDYSLDVPTNITGLHIHNGPAGVNAGVQVNTGVTSMPTGDTPRGRVIFPVEVDLNRPGLVDVINGLYSNPQGFYANLHTTQSPGGLIRGQLRYTDSMNFPVTMLTSNEVPAIAGLDASGAANFTLNSIRGEDGNVIAARAIFDVNYRFPAAATFTGLHIHNQVAGQNGPVTIDSGLSGTNNLPSATGFGNIYRVVSVMSATALAAANSVVASPEKHYLNLHTTVNPGGAVRSQLRNAFAQAPTVTDAISLVVDPGQRDIAPGGLAGLFGRDLAYVETDVLSMEGARMPMSMNGVEVTIGGKTAPIMTVTPNMIAVQVPFDVEAGTQPVVVKNAVGTARSVNATVARVAPGIFRFGSDGGQILKTDYTFVTPDNPVGADEDIWIWTTGLGQTTPALTTGRYTPDTGTFTTEAVTATVGGRTATVSGSIATPGLPGVYRVTLRVPSGLTAGPQPLQLRMGTAGSNTVMLYVK